MSLTMKIRDWKKVNEHNDDGHQVQENTKKGKGLASIGSKP